jgi:ADP-ribosyl-[dinitrogen reductase] hydrolase
MEARDRYRGCLLGLAAGDAVGTTVEFMPRGAFAPVKDMVGGGPFDLKAGQWTDDTSMALCLAESLIECAGFDARDQMRRYCDWWLEGHLSSTGDCFDIGDTVSSALQRFQASGDPFAGSAHPMSAGNGSIMRLAPVVLFYHPNRARASRYAADSSRTTHAAQEAIDSCVILSQVLCNALEGHSKADVLLASPPDTASERLSEVCLGSYRGRPESAIRGSGYVVDCLEAAFWCFDRTESFEDAVLMAANLGDDADTTAAVVGQIAGAHYGEEGIPSQWRARLALYKLILEYSDGLQQGAA